MNAKIRPPRPRTKVLMQSNQPARRHLSIQLMAKYGRSHKRSPVLARPPPSQERIAMTLLQSYATSLLTRARR